MSVLSTMGYVFKGTMHPRERLFWNIVFDDERDEEFLYGNEDAFIQLCELVTFRLGNVSIRCSQIWAVASNGFLRSPLASGGLDSWHEESNGGFFPYEISLVIAVAAEYREAFGYKMGALECDAVLRYLKKKYSVTRVLLEHNAAGVMEAALVCGVLSPARLGDCSEPLTYDEIVGLLRRHGNLGSSFDRPILELLDTSRITEEAKYSINEAEIKAGRLLY